MVVGLNPAVYCMAVSVASYYISNEKKKNKGSQKGGGAGATFDWMFFDNSKLIYFDD